MARYLKKRKRGWYFVMEIPAQHRAHFGTARVEQTLGTRDESLAEAKAQKLAGDYKLRFLALEGNADAERTLSQAEYHRALQQARRGELRAYTNDDEIDPADFGTELAIDAIVDAAPVQVDRYGDPEPVLSAAEDARVAGLMDGWAERMGQKPRNRERFEPLFKELADRWLEGWKNAPDRRLSNTASQYASAIRLFAEFWGDRSLREVTQKDAAEFVELLRRLPSNHGRGSLAGVPLKEAVTLFGGAGPGLATPTIKRHLLVLKQIWGWAKPLGYCAGDDPFQVRLPKHRTRPYLGWETSDLQRLFAAPPRRRDIYEAFQIAMFTALRVGEIADLTWGQVRTEQGITYLLIEDAKTEAGHRKVPLHQQLAWLLQKVRGADADPIFTSFNPEGPRKSRSGDASKLFGAWKRGLGITSDRYVFHSARKNVTRIMEENGVSSDAWARIIGHEPGFTYGTYNPAALSLSKARETMELIAYPEVNMRPPVEVYRDATKLSKDKRVQQSSM